MDPYSAHWESQACYRADWLMIELNNERSSYGNTEGVAQPERKPSQTVEAKKALTVLISSVIGKALGRICNVQ